MKTEVEIISLANSIIKAAEYLLDGGFYSDAYYLAGYGFELLLKAKICKTLLIPDFFDFENSKNRRLTVNNTRKQKENSGNLYKSFKVHDYEQLLILSGLYTEFSNNIINDLDFGADWYVISLWDESLRYSTNNSKIDVESFIYSIKNMMLWLQQRL